MRKLSVYLKCCVILTAGLFTLALSAGLYLSAVELKGRAERTYLQAEEVYRKAKALKEQAEAAQEQAETAVDDLVMQVLEVPLEVVRLDCGAEERIAAEFEKQIATSPVAPRNDSEEGLADMGTYTITAYCPCEICCGYWATTRPLDENGGPIVYTASGARAEAGKTIAVDPAVIPHGTSVWFEGPDGLQEYIAQDTGSAVDGNHIDLYFDSHEEALAWGFQSRQVFRAVTP